MERHNTVSEGILVGAAGAVAVALWFLLVDLIAGQPLYTPRVLGEGFFTSLFGDRAPTSAAAFIIGYTVVHFVAFAMIGMVATALVHAARVHAALLAGVFILFVAFQVIFYGVVSAVALAPSFGDLAWWQIGAANLVAAAVMGYILWRRHPMLARAMDGALAGGE